MFPRQLDLAGNYKRYVEVSWCGIKNRAIMNNVVSIKHEKVINYRYLLIICIYREMEMIIYGYVVQIPRSKWTSVFLSCIK